MDCTILNFKRFESGALVGFFDLSVNGLVVTGCKAFKRPTDNGEDRHWFGWPSEKIQDKDGNDQWRDIVTAAEPVMRHLQTLLRPQIRALLTTGSSPVISADLQRRAGQPQPTGGHRQEELSKYRSPSDANDIPF